MLPVWKVHSSNKIDRQTPAGFVVVAPERLALLNSPPHASSYANLARNSVTPLITLKANVCSDTGLVALLNISGAWLNPFWMDQVADIGLMGIYFSRREAL